MRKALVVPVVIVLVLVVAIVAVLLILDRNTTSAYSEDYHSTNEKTGEFYYDGAWYKERSDVESFYCWVLTSLKTPRKVTDLRITSRRTFYLWLLSIMTPANVLLFS